MRRTIELLKNKSTSLSLALIVALGIVLRLYNLGAKSIWYDEAFEILLAEEQVATVLDSYIHSLPQSIAGVAYQHDIAMFFLLHPLTDLSSAEHVMRLVPALFGVLSIIVLYFIGKILCDTKVGLMSAFILAISPYHVWYSQMVRFHTVTTFFTLLSLYFFLLALKRNRAWHWALYALSSALNVYVFSFGLFILIVEALYVLLWHRRDRQALKGWFLSQTGILTLLLPLVPVFISQAARGSQEAARAASGAGISIGLPLVISYGQPWYVFTLGSLFPSPTHLLVALPGLALTGVLVMRGMWSQRQRKARTSFLLLYLFVPYLLGLSVWLAVSTIALGRSLMLVSPAYYILIALGILSLRNHKLRAGLLTLLIALSSFCLYAHYTTDIYQGLKLGATYVKEHAQEKDAILHLAGSDPLTFEYYVRDEVPAYWASGGELEAAERGIANGTIDRVWVVAYRQLSTTERMMAMYGGEEVADQQADQSMDTLLREMGLIKVEEIAFPGENKLTLGLYARD